MRTHGNGINLNLFSLLAIVTKKPKPKQQQTRKSMPSSDIQTSQRDKRGSYRIDEQIHLEFKTVTNSFVEHNNIEDAFNDNDESLRLINQLRKLDKSGIQSLKILTDKNRLLGDYLQVLNNKIDNIGRYIAFNSTESLQNRPLTRVSLSEDGLSFAAPRQLYKDSFIALRLIFPPNYAIATSFAKVVRCEKQHRAFDIAVQFYKMYDKDRQIISRQVLKSQVRSRQASSNTF